MAAGVTIKLKRKSGAFTGGDLAAGEAGVDVTNNDFYFSKDGSTVTQIQSGGGDVSASGTPADGQIGVWTDATTIEGDSALTFDTTTDTLVIAVSGKINFGGVTILDDSSGTTTLSNIDALDATTEATIEAAIDTLTNLTITESQISDLGAAVTLNADTDVSGNSWVLDEDDMSSDSDTKVPTQQSVKAYVDSAVTGLLEYQGGYNASTNSPDLDVSPSGQLQGDVYVVTAAGTFFSTEVEIGDMLIAEQDAPTLIGHWTIVQANIDGAALTSGTLAQFAATTSAQLAGVISDETGSGLLVFGTSPTIATPDLTLKTGTSPTAEGDIEWNSTDDTILVGDGSGTKTFSADDDISITEAQISDLGTLAAMVADSLDVFAATTSAELAGVISDETGTGLLVFSISPVLTTPQINDTSSDHQYVFAVNELTADRTITLPLLASNDTFVFENHAQTLANKTISDSGSTIDGGTI